MLCADYTDLDMQNPYFEGFTQRVEVTNFFVFNFHGELIHAAVNYPGYYHDMKVAIRSGLYDLLLNDETTSPGKCLLGDTAFTKDFEECGGKLIRSRKANETACVPKSSPLAAIDLLLERVMLQERHNAK